MSQIDMKGHKGFSVVELLIVVVVILIVTAIAVPNLIVSRRAANEGAALSSMRTLHSADMTYASTLGNGDFAGQAGTVNASSITDLHYADLIDSSLGSATKSNYVFVGSRQARTTSSVATFYFAANPITASGILRTGTRRFGVPTDGIVKFDATEANLATPFDETALQSAIATPAGE